MFQPRTNQVFNRPPIEATPPPPPQQEVSSQLARAGRWGTIEATPPPPPRQEVSSQLARAGRRGTIVATPPPPRRRKKGFFGSLLSKPLKTVGDGLASLVRQGVVPPIVHEVERVTQQVNSIVQRATAPVTHLAEQITAPVTRPVARLLAPVLEPVSSVLKPINDVLKPIEDVLRVVTIITGASTMEMGIREAVKHAFHNHVLRPILYAPAEHLLATYTSFRGLETALTAPVSPILEPLSHAAGIHGSIERLSAQASQPETVLNSLLSGVVEASSSQSNTRQLDNEEQFQLTLLEIERQTCDQIERVHQEAIEAEKQAISAKESQQNDLYLQKTSHHGYSEKSDVTISSLSFTERSKVDRIKQEKIEEIEEISWNAYAAVLELRRQRIMVAQPVEPGRTLTPVQQPLVPVMLQAVKPDISGSTTLESTGKIKSRQSQLQKESVHNRVIVEEYARHLERAATSNQLIQMPQSQTTQTVPHLKSQLTQGSEKAQVGSSSISRKTINESKHHESSDHTLHECVHVINEAVHIAHHAGVHVPPALHKFSIFNQLISNTAASQEQNLDTRIIEGAATTATEMATTDLNLALAGTVGVGVIATAPVSVPIGVVGGAATIAVGGTFLGLQEVTGPACKEVGKNAAKIWEHAKPLFREQQDILASELELPRSSDLKRSDFQPTF